MVPRTHAAETPNKSSMYQQGPHRSKGTDAILQLHRSGRHKSVQANNSRSTATAANPSPSKTSTENGPSDYTRLGLVRDATNQVCTCNCCSKSPRSSSITSCTKDQGESETAGRTSPTGSDSGHHERRRKRLLHLHHGKTGTGLQSTVVSNLRELIQQAMPRPTHHMQSCTKNSQATQHNRTRNTTDTSRQLQPMHTHCEPSGLLQSIRCNQPFSSP